MKITGLIDLQVNGYKGVDFSSPQLTEEDFVRACRQMLDAGISAFLPTIITSPTKVYERNLPLMAKVIQSGEFKNRLFGVHLEGPFISPNDGVRGAHNAYWIRKPDISLLDRLIEWSQNTIRLITIAAEVEGAEELARHATERGIVVSLGHQAAKSEPIKALADAGARALTHLGNGVPAVMPRHENPVWAGLAEDGLSAMIVTDGHHLPPAMIKVIIRAKTPQRCILTSDASPLAGMPPGCYEALGQKTVLEPSGRLYNPDTGYLVGSSATLLDCVNYLASLNIVTDAEIAEMAFRNPLRLLNIDRDGSTGSPPCGWQKAG